jgi:hypothetical protein
VQGLPLLVEAGYSCLVLLASNVFVRTQPYLLFLNKNNAPHECGNPKCKAIALLLAIGRTIPSPSSTLAGCKIANRMARESSWHPPPMPNSTN